MRTIAIFLALGLAVSGCELVKKLQNRRVMGGLVVQIPSVNEISVGVSIPGATVAYLFLGERQDDGTNFSENPPTGLTGANVTLSWDGGPDPLTLASGASAGQYQTAANGDSYVVGAEYSFRAVLGGDTYTGSVTAPAEGAIQEFVVEDPPVKTQKFDTFVSFTITRASTASDTLAFYTVMDSGGTVTCTNGPTQDNPERLLDIIFNPDAYKVPSFDLTKENCFPSAGAYAVELTTLKQGSVSDNLFLVSAVFAGTASAGVLVLK